MPGAEVSVGTMTVRLEVVHGMDHSVHGEDESYMVLRFRGVKLQTKPGHDLRDVVDVLKFERDYGDLDPDGALGEAVDVLRRESGHAS